jgi:hypothetical protein
MLPRVSPDLPLLTRLWFSWVCSWRVIFDGSFAGAVWRLVHEAERSALPVALPASPASPPSVTAVEPQPRRFEHALQLLALLQREGRLVDFLEQDVAAFSDADIGAAARVVHDGCRRALHAQATLSPLRTEEEGATVTLAGEVSADEVKLTGNVKGKPPFTGVLRHRGWRATTFALPAAVRGYDASVLAPAEVEL